MYVPPASGIAVAISDFESAAGTTSSPASTYAITTPVPAVLTASAGRMKMPLPIMAPMLIASTAGSPRSFSSSFGTVTNLRHRAISLPSSTPNRPVRPATAPAVRLRSCRSGPRRIRRSRFRSLLSVWTPCRKNDSFRFSYRDSKRVFLAFRFYKSFSTDESTAAARDAAGSRVVRTGANLPDACATHGMSETATERLRNNAVKITSLLITGLWMGGLFLTNQDWWLGVLIVGYAAVLPIVKTLFGEDEEEYDDADEDGEWSHWWGREK